VIPMLEAVQRYQVARMRVTHADLLRSPVYRPLCDFFLDDLYGAPDIAARAVALRSMTDIVKPILGRWMYEGARGLVELQTLSDTLDRRLAEQLLQDGASTSFGEAEFEDAYVRSDDDADRLRQIDLTTACNTFVHSLSQHSSAGRLLWLARRLSSLRRLESLFRTLERGYQSYRGIGDIRPFNEAMRAGERAYLDALYARRRD
jgi:hypothetical protein